MARASSSAASSASPARSSRVLRSCGIRGQLRLAEGDLRELLGVLGLLVELAERVEGLAVLGGLGEQRLPVPDGVVALGEVLAELRGAAEPGRLVRVGPAGLARDTLVGARQLLVAAGHPGEPLEVGAGAGAIHVLGEGLAGGEERPQRLAHVPLLDGADLLGEADLLVGQGIGHPRFADRDAAGVLAGAGQDGIQRVQRAPAVRVVRPGPGLEQVQRRRVAGVLGEHLPEQLEGAAEVLELLTPELGEPEGGLATLRTLPLLRPSELEGEGEVLELPERGVEPVERRHGLPVQRIRLRDPAPGGRRALAILELALEQEGHLAPEREPLRRIGHHPGERLQDGDQPAPVVARTEQPLQGPERVGVARIHRQDRLELADGATPVVELLLLHVGELAVERDARRGGQIRPGHQLLEHVGEAIHRVRVLCGPAGGGAEVRVGGRQAQGAREGGEGELGLPEVMQVDMRRLLEGEHPLELVLRHLGDEVQRGDELAVLLDRFVGGDEGARGLGTHRVVLQQRLQRRQGLGVVRLLVQDGGVRLDGIGTGPQTRGLPFRDVAVVEPAKPTKIAGFQAVAGEVGRCASGVAAGRGSAALGELR